MSHAPTRKRLARLRDGAQLVMFADPADVAFLMVALDEAIHLLQPRNVPSCTDAKPFAEYVKRRTAFLKLHAAGGEVLYPEDPAAAARKEHRAKNKAERAAVATEKKMTKVFGAETAKAVKTIARGKAPVPRKSVRL